MVPPITILTGSAELRSRSEQASQAIQEAFRFLKASQSESLGKRLNAVHERLRRTTVDIAFVGRFSNGKSTLVNALVGRDVLPVARMPKTGVTCMIQAGASDAATVQYRDGGSKRIAFYSTAIERYTSLTTSRGEARDLSGVERVDLEVAGVAIPSGTRWFDTPGIGDKPDEAERSQRSKQTADQADVLVVVLHSEQALGLEEQRYLRSRLTQRGLASVVFVFNVRPPRFADPDEFWGSTLWEEEAPSAEARIKDFVDEFPADRNVQIRPLFLSPLETEQEDNARALEHLRGYLATLSFPSSAQVHYTRLAHAATELEEIERQVAIEYDVEKERCEGDASETKASQTAVERARQQFVGAMEGHVLDAVSSISSAYSSAASEFASYVVGDSDAPHTYDQSEVQRALRSDLADVARPLVFRLFEKAGGEMVDALNRQPSPIDPSGVCELEHDGGRSTWMVNAFDEAFFDRLWDVLEPWNVSVEIPNTGLKGRDAGKGALIGGGIGMLFGPLGAAAGAAIGSSLTSFAKAYEEDRAQMRRNIRDAGSSQAARVRRLAPDAVALFAEVAGRLKPVVTQQSRSRLESLAVLRDTLRRARLAATIPSPTASGPTTHPWGTTASA